jgi:hypothetical protein
VFAAQRTTDSALTVMAINKDLSSSPAVSLHFSNFTSGGPAQVWQLTSSNAIVRLADAAVSSSTIAATLPAQSITLFVIPFSPGGQAPRAPTDLRISAAGGGARGVWMNATAAGTNLNQASDGGDHSGRGGIISQRTICVPRFSKRRT